MKETLWECEACADVMTEKQMRRAAHPFQDGETVIGCRKCGALGEFRELCDEPGCKNTASSGWPTADGGYRRTCYSHWKYAKEPT